MRVLDQDFDLLINNGLDWGWPGQNERTCQVKGIGFLFWDVSLTFVTQFYTNVVFLYMLLIKYIYSNYLLFTNSVLSS